MRTPSSRAILRKALALVLFSAIALFQVAGCSAKTPALAVTPVATPSSGETNESGNTKRPASEPDSAPTNFLKGTWLVAGAPIWVPLFFVEEFHDEHERNKASVFWRACGAKITDALKQMPTSEWHQDCACVVFPLEVEKETLPRGFTLTNATAPDGLEEQVLCRNDRAVIYALKWAHDDAPAECKHTMHQTCDSVIAHFGD